MQRLLLHLGFWLTYLAINSYVEVALAGASFEHYPLWHKIGMGVGTELLLLPVKIVVTYTVLYRLLPPFFEHRRWRPTLAMVGISVGFAALLNLAVLYQAVYPLIYQETGSWTQFSVGRFIWSTIDISSVVGLATAFKFLRLRLNSLEKEKALIQEKAASEIRFLRSQTNPHFLFNVLNTIYALARKKDDQTENVVMQLSKLLRFMIYECSAPQIPLSRELQVIKDYLALEQLRFPKRLSLSYEEQVDDNSCQIPPLLLLPLVENAFKHGVGEGRFSTDVKISLQLKNSQLTFSVFNSLETDTDRDDVTKEGIGLNNLQRQLKLLFPKRHQLRLEAQPNFYTATLKIDLQI